MKIKVQVIRKGSVHYKQTGYMTIGEGVKLNRENLYCVSLKRGPKAVFKGSSLEVVEERNPTTCELKVGDVVTIIDQSHGWGNKEKVKDKLGTVVDIQHRDSGPIFYLTVKGYGVGTWACTRSCVLFVGEGDGVVPPVPHKAPPPPPKHKFKVGDKVKIATTSEYYKEEGDVMNPIDVEGEVVKVLKPKTDYNTQVKWGDVVNSYNEEDLIGV